MAVAVKTRSKPLTRLAAPALVLLVLVSMALSAAAAPVCSGDVNGDGVVNIFDLVLLVTKILAGAFDSLFDLVADGVLNILDIVRAATNFGCTAACQEGETQSCYTGLPGTQNVGVCKAGTQTCSGGDWSACAGETKSSPEACGATGKGDGLDNDCDGQTDEGCLSCSDNDGDGYFAGTGCSPLDCDDNDAAKKTDCPAPGEALISNLKPSHVRAEKGLSVGDTVYIDRDYTYTNVDGKLAGLDYLVPANEDKFLSSPSSLSFDVGSRVIVYVGYVIGPAIPSWLSSWTPTSLALATSANNMKVYQKTFAPGTVALGGNLDPGAGGGHSNYVVVVEENCDEGEVLACGSDVGRCQAGTRTCVNKKFGACVGSIGPTTEAANGLDDDCDGLTDEGLCAGCGLDGQACTAQTCSALSYSDVTCVYHNTQCKTCPDACEGLSSSECTAVAASCGLECAVKNNQCQFDFTLLPQTPGLRAPVKLYDNTGAGVTNEMVSNVFIALPDGLYTPSDLPKFRILDGAGNAISADFVPGRTRTMRDNSVREVFATFKATVPPGGESTYYFQDYGPTPPAGPSLQVTQTTTTLDVDTGKVKFRVKKTGFNIFDKVWVGNTLIVDNSVGQAGQRIVNRFGNTLWFSERDANETPFIFEVKEQTPKRIVLKVHSPGTAVTSASNPYAKFMDNTNSEPVHDVSFYITAEAGSDTIKVQQILASTATTKDFRLKGWPFFYESDAMVFRLAGSNTEMRVGLNGSTEQTLASGKVIQGNNAQFSGSGLNAQFGGWAEVKDKSSGYTMTAYFPHLRRTPPGGFELQGNTFTVHTAPDGWGSLLGNTSGFSGVGSLYSVGDFRGAYRELHYRFASTSLNDHHAKQKLAEDPIIGFSDYPTLQKFASTDDLLGILPEEGRLDKSLSGIAWNFTNYSNAQGSFGSTAFMEHYGVFPMNMERYDITGQGGGLPHTGEQVLINPRTRNAVHWWGRQDALARMIGPEYLGGTNGQVIPWKAYGLVPDPNSSGQILGHEFLQPSLLPESGSGRAYMPNENENTNVPNKPLPEEHRYAAVADPGHHWRETSWDAAFQNNDHATRDILKRYGELMIVAPYHMYTWAKGEEAYASGSKPSTPTVSARGKAWILHGVQNYAELTGDSSVYATGAKYWLDAVDLLQYPDGSTSSDPAHSFQNGFMASVLLDLLDDVDAAQNPEIFNPAWGILFGWKDRLGLLTGSTKTNFTYYGLVPSDGSDCSLQKCPWGGSEVTVINPMIAAIQFLSQRRDPFTGKKLVDLYTYYHDKTRAFLDSGNPGGLNPDPWDTSYLWGYEAGNVYVGQLIPFYGKNRNGSPSLGEPQWSCSACANGTRYCVDPIKHRGQRISDAC